METRQLRPVGVVVSEWHSTDTMTIAGKPAAIRIFPDFSPAMHRIEEHNYFWVLCWFHQADRSILRSRPAQVNSQLPEYGVFGLRTAARPNPIALSLVKLEKIVDDTIYVSGMDAINGTAVLDIKPYFESDIVFSPKTPYIRPKEYMMRVNLFRKQALFHHGENCCGLELGVQMALVADEHFGQIQCPDVELTVYGDPCVADVLQGLTRARLANPARFTYLKNAGPTRVIWKKADKTLIITVRDDIGTAIANETDPQQWFKIEIM
jgi:tRNA-Thr(GGU) m(6)t(6)A37 methyltransferase TsaA